MRVIIKKQRFPRLNICLFKFCYMLCQKKLFVRPEQVTDQREMGSYEHGKQLLFWNRSHYPGFRQKKASFLQSWEQVLRDDIEGSVQNRARVLRTEFASLEKLSRVSYFLLHEAILVESPNLVFFICVKGMSFSVSLFLLVFNLFGYWLRSEFSHF